MNTNLKIKTIIDTAPSGIGIFIVDENTVLLSHNKQRPFRSASIIKLFILSYYLDKNINLDDMIRIKKSQYTEYSSIKELSLTKATLKELLLLMIASSDNTATNVLASLAGLDHINDYIRNTLCLSNTSMNRLMLDFGAIQKGSDNYTSAADVVFILNHLSKHQTALEIMGKQKDTFGLMRYIYNDTDFFGKSGELDDVRNDSGILKTKNKVTVVAILTNGINKQIAEELCGLCGLLAIDSNKPIY